MNNSISNEKYPKSLEKVTPCDEGEYCKNGGACSHRHDTLNPEKSKTYCDCTDTGYEGERCEKKLPERGIPTKKF